MNEAFVVTQETVVNDRESCAIYKWNIEYAYELVQAESSMDY